MKSSACVMLLASLAFPVCAHEAVNVPQLKVSEGAGKPAWSVQQVKRGRQLYLQKQANSLLPQ